MTENNEMREIMFMIRSDNGITALRLPVHCEIRFVCRNYCGRNQHPICLTAIYVFHCPNFHLIYIHFTHLEKVSAPKNE